jgi:hypothetical protein
VEGRGTVVGDLLLVVERVFGTQVVRVLFRHQQVCVMAVVLEVVLVLMLLSSPCSLG